MEPRDDPDVQLMLAVQRGDVRAFEVLYRRHAGPLGRYLCAVLGSPARAEEIAQETFLRAYRARHRYRPAARFTTWLYRIAANLCRSEWRRPATRAEELSDGRTGGPHDPETAPGPEEEALHHERLATVQRLIDDLPPQQRAALWLARVEGLSYAEVARRLGCSQSAVKSLIHRATVRLREGVEGNTGGDEE